MRARCPSDRLARKSKPYSKGEYRGNGSRNRKQTTKSNVPLQGGMRIHGGHVMNFSVQREKASRGACQVEGLCSSVRGGEGSDGVRQACVLGCLQRRGLRGSRGRLGLCSDG